MLTIEKLNTKDKIDLIEEVECFLRPYIDFKQEAKPFYNKENYSKQMIRVIKALLEKKRIKVVGDFDADGVLGGLMSFKYLETINGLLFDSKDSENISYYHTRREDSFGLSMQTYQELSKTTDLFIYVDMGSSLEYLDENTNNVIVLDHHPVELEKEGNRNLEYIINPNANREDDLEYSTSGGHISFVFFNQIHKFLYEKNNTYKKKIQNFRETIEKRIELIEAISSLTLISDMAIMDKNNRSKVIKAVRFIEENKTLIPMFKTFYNDYEKRYYISARNISFNLISMINCINRIDGDMNILTKFIIPKTINEYEEAKAYLDEAQIIKKEIVRKNLSIYEENNIINQKPIKCYSSKTMPIGINGLIANSISTAKNNFPTISMSLKKSGEISGSGRGKNVKKIILDYIEKSGRAGGGGGHNDAMGFSFSKLENEKDNEEAMENFKKGVEEHCSFEDSYSEKDNLNCLFSDVKSIQAFLLIHKEYMYHAQKVDFSKRFFVKVGGFTIKDFIEYKNNWGAVTLSDNNFKRKNISKILIDRTKITKEALSSAPYIYMELTNNGDYVIRLEENKKSV